MKCPVCKKDIGDAEHCPECLSASADSVRSEILDRPKFDLAENENAGTEAAIPDDLGPGSAGNGANVERNIIDEANTSNRQSDVGSEEKKGEFGDQISKAERFVSENSRRAPDVDVANNSSNIGVQIANLGKLFLSGDRESNKPRHSLYADTRALPKLSSPPQCLKDELSERSKELGETHMLVLACASWDIAFSSADSLLTELGIDDLHKRRLYNVKDRFQEGSDITVESFLPAEEEEPGSAAVIVDALSDSGHEYVTSLISDHSGLYRLKEKAIYLISIVRPAYVDEHSANPQLQSGCSYWKISYLDCLLKTYFAERHLELKQVIEEEVKVGWWDTEESGLCYELERFIKAGTALKTIEDRKGNRPPALLPPESIFQDESSDDPPVLSAEVRIERTVIYVATYFQNLAPREFNEIVEALLRDDDDTEPAPQAGEVEQLRAGQSGGRAVIDIWREHKDRFMWRYLKETAASDEMTTVVDFANPSARPLLKSYLEDSRRYYVKDQFSLLQRRGFLFHPDNRVAENMIRLTANAFVSYPDEFNKDWLVSLIVNLYDSFSGDRAAVPVFENGILSFLSFVPSNRAAWGYSRMSELIRELIKLPQTADLVNRALSDLMRMRYYEPVLNIVKRLRFAADFDGLYWLKRLFDNGDSDIRQQAFVYLYYTVKESDSDIHQTLNRLESWVPSADPNRRNWPKSTCFALLLLIRYSFQTIRNATEKHKNARLDAGPIEYSLLSFANDAAARTGVERIFRWLLHPAIANTVRDLESDPQMKNLLSDLDLESNPHRVLGILLVEWTVILLRHSDFADDDLNQSADQLQDGDGLKMVRRVFALLIENASRLMSDVHRKDLIDFWEDCNRELLRMMTRVGRENREQMFARWKNVFFMTQELRKAPTRKQAA